METEFSPGDKAKDGKVSKRPRRMEGPSHHHFEGVSTEVFIELAWKMSAGIGTEHKRSSMAESANHQHRAEEAEETEMKLQDEQVTLARPQSHLQRRMIAGRQKKAWSSHEEEAEARKRQRKLLGR